MGIMGMSALCLGFLLESLEPKPVFFSVCFASLLQGPLLAPGETFHAFVDPGLTVSCRGKFGWYVLVNRGIDCVLDVVPHFVNRGAVRVVMHECLAEFVQILLDLGKVALVP